MQRTTILPGALVGALAAGLMFGASCAGSSKGPAACPGSGWCGSATEAGTIAEPATGTTFTCPIGLHAGVATEAGATPPAGVPAGAKGTLDERATRAKRNAGDATTCCYVWNQPCPS